MSSSVLSRLSTIFGSYAQRRQLSRELATYDVRALNDLGAAIARCPADGDAETRQLRRLVDAQRSALAPRG